MTASAPLLVRLLLVLMTLPAVTARASLAVDQTLSDQESSTSVSRRTGAATYTATLSGGPPFDGALAFSSLGETNLSITISAPAGQVFSASYASAGSLQIGWRFGDVNFQTGSYTDSSPTITFADFVGAPLVLNTTFGDASEVFLAGPAAHPLFRSQPRIAASALYDIPAGASFSFSSVTFSTVVPASHDTDYPSTSTLAPSFLAEIEGRYITPAPLPDEPGQFLALSNVSAIPEASSFLCFGLLSMGVGLGRRRTVRETCFGVKPLR